MNSSSADSNPLLEVYRDYISCLNRRDWPKLQEFVHDDVRHNGSKLGMSGYRAMLDRRAGRQSFDRVYPLQFRQRLRSRPCGNYSAISELTRPDSTSKATAISMFDRVKQ